LTALGRQNAGDNALFTQYHRRNPVRWNQGWPWRLDLSGVSWDQPNAVTAITRRHVVMAQHFPRKIGQSVTFHDRRGRSHTRRMIQVIPLRDRGLRTDIAVGLLDRPLPKQIRRYPLPQPTPELTRRLIGQNALVTEQTRRLFFHRIAAIENGRLRFEFNPELPQTSRKPLISGDSGHPAFVLSRGELVLIETHSLGGPGLGPFYGAPDILEKIRKITIEMDPKWPMRTVPIDPS
jgi:hypothetical protein